MNDTEKLAQNIKDILNLDTGSNYRDAKCRINVIGNEILITYGQMYESPTLNFASLIKLSELFGTQEIDVDDYAHSGCDTCDYGSDYGHEISIKNATKNIMEINNLNNKDLFE